LAFHSPLQHILTGLGLPAIGTFAGFQSICTMIASSLAGLIWYKFGVAATFITAATVTILVIIYFLISVPFDRKGRLIING